MGVAQAGGFCSGRDFVLIAPMCMYQCLYHWRSKSSMGDFDIFKSQGRKSPWYPPGRAVHGVLLQVLVFLL